MSRSTIFARLVLSPTVRLWSRLTRNPVNRYSAMVLFGNLARFGLGFVASVLLARGLGPAGMGIYASLGVVVVIATVLLDFGLTPTAINRMAERLGAGNDARTVSGTYFWLKLGIAAVGCAIGTVVAGPLARLVLGSAGGPGLLRLALWSVFAAALSGASAAMLQASGRFQALVRTWLVNTVLTVLLVVGLTLTAALNVGTAFWVAILTSLAGFAAGLYWLRPAGLTLALPARPAWRSEATALLRFGRWLWLGQILALGAGQVDVLLLLRWASPATAGVYALALNLASKLDVINQTLYTVLLTEASSLSTSASLAPYVRASLRRSGVIVLGLAPIVVAALFSRPFIAAVYGAAFADAANVLGWLVAAVAFDALMVPLQVLIYPLNRPRIAAASDSLRLAGVLVLTIVLLPHYGAAGAALARLLSKMLAAIPTAALIAVRLRNDARSRA